MAEQFSSMMEEEDDEDETLKTRVFSNLKPYCINLLQLLQNPNHNHKNVSKDISLLHDFIQKTPSHALQPFLDYAMFPLLLLLDAAVGCRSPQKGDSPMPNAISDSVAEGTLSCLEELLRKCHLGSVNQMVVVLKKLTYGAMLSPSDASEEFREGIVRCFKALLLRIHPCSDKSCLCNEIRGMPALSAGNNLEILCKAYSDQRSESDECLLAFLQSQNASAAVGHWLSLLLKIADTEAARGHRGSARLRVEAFWTLRVLVAKVGTADALAFFLPGVVSQFAKVLHVSKTMTSGAAGSTEAIDQATKGLVEFLMIVLQDKENHSGLDCPKIGTLGFNDDKSTHLFIEALRQLPVNSQNKSEMLEANSSNQAVVLKGDIKDKRNRSNGGYLSVNRTKDWIKETSEHVDKLLSATFPHLCVHPAKKVRQAVVESIQGLLSDCSYTLKRSRLMMLECLCVLVCDDSEEVSVAAQEFLETLFTVGDKDSIEHEIAEIFNRLIEKLPKVVLGSDETNALAFAQRLLSIMYYSGPQIVVDNLLYSPIIASRFLEVITLCLDQNSVYTGSLDKFIMERPLSVGYLHSIAELRSPSRIRYADKHLQTPVDFEQKDYEVPKMPPWFVFVGSQKLYQVLASVLRLVGLAVMSDSRTEVSLSAITEIPLNCLRKLISEVRTKQYRKESWNTWYRRNGQLVRKASTAICVLNEIIYGISNQSAENLVKMFRSKELTNKSAWEVCSGLDTRGQLTDCIGSILHEYLSLEIWDIPIDPKVSLSKEEYEVEDMTLHLFRDTTMLQQVIIDGIGTFSVCLGKVFSSSGFLQSSLYLLLEKLICSSVEIRKASDAILHVISASAGYPSVGCLVVSNADYIIDSLCRELRHLDLNPHVPNVISAILSYVGIAKEILPLLEEPMRSVSSELEVLSRHQHPNLTLPFLKGVAEIVKSSKSEAFAMPAQAETYSLHVKSKVSDIEKMNNDCDTNIEKLEEMMFKLNDSKRYRRIVGSIAGSCLVSATPLLASFDESACLVSLDIVEDGVAALANIEQAYKHEKATKQEIARGIQLCSFHDLEDTLDADDEPDENRLLPAMNKIWPNLVICLKNKNSLAVRRCLSVVSSTVQICGGDFFSRRFQSDGPHFWKILTTSPFSKKPILHDDKRPLQLPYRTISTSSSESLSESSSLKVQISALNMIADLSRNKKSSSSLEVVLKKVSGLVVGIACSNVAGLHDAAVNALSGLSCMDPDLIWLLLADVYYSLTKRDAPSPPVMGLPDISQVLPSPVSDKDFLFVQYGGSSFGFGVDVFSVEKVFHKMQKDVFPWQM
ncbi:hypothetical protein ACHQM5_028707 [Ranunculus cassubicifolius]